MLYPTPIESNRHVPIDMLLYIYIYIQIHELLVYSMIYYSYNQPVAGVIYVIPLKIGSRALTVGF